MCVPKCRKSSLTTFKRFLHRKFCFFSSKTNAERQRAFRLKDPQEYKARNKIYVREYKEKLKITLTAEEKEEKRIKAREYNSKSRQKKREEQANDSRKYEIKTESNSNG